VKALSVTWRRTFERSKDPINRFVFVEAREDGNMAGAAPRDDYTPRQSAHPASNGR
jgi:hypothetical protein